LLHEANGENTLSRASVSEWHKRFTEVREDVGDDERHGRPVTMKTDENVENSEDSCENRSSFRYQSDRKRGS